MFGKCSVCLEKDKRIEDLKEQITNLRLTINPPPRVNKYEMEQDFVLDGGNKEQLVTPISEEAQKQIQEQLAKIQLEQDQILSGTY